MSVNRVIFTYVNGRQTFTVPPGITSDVRYHCWGGGGGAGGASGAQSGGSGSAGGYTTGTFPVRVGDEIEVCVGGGGQQGLVVNSGRKIASAEQPGLNATAAGNTGCFGVVPNPTGNQYYPVYGDRLVNRTAGSTWSSFMNTYAVWPNTSSVAPSEETWENQIWFPEDRTYTFGVAADNEARFFLDDELIRSTFNNFNSADFFSRRVSKGLHTLRIQAFNTGARTGNPAGVACLIDATNNSTFNPTFADVQPPQGIIWHTRLGTTVNLTSSVPVWAAPLCTFYQPTTDNYNWGSFSRDRNFAFVSATSTWTAEDLAKLNFSFNNIYTLSSPVKITGVGDIDHFITTGYYRFKQGESWDSARYNWLGDQQNNTIIPFDKRVPNSWVPRQNMTYSAANRQRNQVFATWDLPVPAPDEIFVVGFVDGQARTTGSRGSSNLRWTVNNVDGQIYGGGDAGRSRINLGPSLLNFYGGWGGQQGGRVISGGGGGGGGASTINIVGASKVSNITVAAGGGGGGGAGSRNDGTDASSRFQAVPTINPQRSAGGTGGFTPVGGVGGGGGGGGGADGGQGGPSGESVGSGGVGAAAGRSESMINLGIIPRAEFVMVGQGGFGGAFGGGGGGGGDVITGTVQLRKTQRIEIGGAGGRGDEWDGTTVIRFSETEYVVAGPGGKGGEVNAPWGSRGEGQPGGVSGDSRTPTWGGSGGGAGVELRSAVAAGGSASTWAGLGKTPGTTAVTSRSNSGGGTGGSPSYSSGGGGGAGGQGVAGESAGKAGNGGNGREVTVGGKKYTLGAGGGGSAGRRRKGIQFAGLGGRGGGGDGESGVGNGLEYTVPGEYSFTVPRDVTSMIIEGIAGGGGGGTGAARGNGGGGSGGSLAPTSFTVFPGRTVRLIVGGGGKSGENGVSSRLTIFNDQGMIATDITLQGGRAGTSTPAATPLGGAGGTPNGNAGGNGGNPDGQFFYSGRGADSPHGSGGKDASTNSKAPAADRAPGNADGFGAGGGGGYLNRAGGLGSGGFFKVEWNGVDSKSGLPNTGSGGGGGCEDFGGNGGTGFCVIAYAGAPVFRYIVNNRPVEPLQENGYTIHECRTTGDLVFIDNGGTGETREGNGAVPAAQNVEGYVPGTGSGGFGRDSSVFPVQSSVYPQFLNNHGVWDRDPDAARFDRDFQVFFPASTEYVLTCYADNGATVSIDGGTVLDLTPADRDNGTYWWKNGLQTRRSIAAGQRTLSWRATNLATAGAFALTIAPANNPAQLVFDSRRPPATGGSGNGGHGLVILEFPAIAGATQIKIPGANWRKVEDTWIKISDAWKKVQGAWIKINGVWKALYAAGDIISSISTTDFGGPPKPGEKTDVTCIGVIDETQNGPSNSTLNTQWNAFRSTYPARPLWVLKVARSDNLAVYFPPNFNPSNLGFRADVNRDNGAVARASDWFTITGCDGLSPGSKVALSIDVSGSMNRSSVQASINLFVSQCQQAGLNLVLNGDMGGENYIAPFNRAF
jgi:hypothetical protein